MQHRNPALPSVLRDTIHEYANELRAELFEERGGQSPSIISMSDAAIEAKINELKSEFIVSDEAKSIGARLDKKSELCQLDLVDSYFVGIFNELKDMKSYFKRFYTINVAFFKEISAKFTNDDALKKMSDDEILKIITEVKTAFVKNNKLPSSPALFGEKNKQYEAMQQAYSNAIQSVKDRKKSLSKEINRAAGKYDIELGQIESKNEGKKPLLGGRRPS